MSIPLNPRAVGGVIVTGLKQALAKQKARQTQTNRLLLAGLLTAGRELQADAQMLTPVDTGQLKKSARTDARRKGVYPEVWVSFNTDYALLQHETLWFNHRIGQAKYLSTPAKLKRDRYVKICRDTVLGPFAP